MKEMFSLKYDACWENVKTETVFTETEMNNDGNVIFFQNMRDVQKLKVEDIFLWWEIAQLAGAVKYIDCFSTTDCFSAEE